MNDKKWVLPEIDLERCDACGDCVTACPGQVLELSAKKPVFRSPQQCTYCTDCEGACPQAAIRCPLEFSWE